MPDQRTHRRYGRRSLRRKRHRRRLRKGNGFRVSPDGTSRSLSFNPSGMAPIRPARCFRSDGQSLRNDRYRGRGRNYLATSDAVPSSACPGWGDRCAIDGNNPASLLIPGGLFGTTPSGGAPFRQQRGLNILSIPTGRRRRYSLQTVQDTIRFRGSSPISRNNFYAPLRAAQAMNDLRFRHVSRLFLRCPLRSLATTHLWVLGRPLSLPPGALSSSRLPPPLSAFSSPPALPPSCQARNHAKVLECKLTLCPTRSVPGASSASAGLRARLKCGRRSRSMCSGGPTSSIPTFRARAWIARAI